VGLLQTDVSEERVSYVIRVEEITQAMEVTRRSETSVCNKPTLRHIPEDGSLDVTNFLNVILI
jgi:hypothetical protein